MNDSNGTGLETIDHEEEHESNGLEERLIKAHGQSDSFIENRNKLLGQ